jgi:hypothetical protein
VGVVIFTYKLTFLKFECFGCIEFCGSDLIKRLLKQKALVSRREAHSATRLAFSAFLQRTILVGVLPVLF